MMKHLIISALAIFATLPAAVNVQAQDDDDIYFSKKANKKATHEAIYAATEEFEWQTDANNDWDLDDYNRRGKATVETTTATTTDVVSSDNEPAFYYEIPDGNGGTTKVPGNKKILKGSDVDKYKIINDTIVLVEQYRFSDYIRRFHNPFFSYYRYSPWYDVAFYDPFYWDYCYYDPWWYVTPSFGFHWGSWYGGWSFGYYTGWYGGWYSPFYHPLPHYYSCWGGGYYHSHDYIVHHSIRNNFGGHFHNRGGWRGNGGSSRLASASLNRSYRAANGAHIGRSNNGNYVNGPTLRGRNVTNGRIANSNMRSSNHEIFNREINNSINNSNRGYGRLSASERRTNVGTRESARSLNNSNYRRSEVGVTQRDNGSRRSPMRSESASRSNRSYNNTPSYSGSESSHYNRGSAGSYNSSRSSSAGSSTRSSGGFSGGSHSGGGFSGGGSNRSSGGGGRGGRR